MSIRIRIKNTPKAQTGDQVGFGLFTGPHDYNDAQPVDSIFKNILTAVPRDQANVEAEHGETAIGDFDKDGQLEHFKIGGDRHSKGGTPLSVPDGTFIFSDTKKMTIKGEVLRNFGISPSKKGFTPAKIAKQYDLNSHKVVLNDPNSDNLDKVTAQLMIENNNQKLGELALLQESMKGFPNGIPQIAAPLMNAAEEGIPVMKFGGLVKARDGMIYDTYLPIDRYKGGKTKKGSTTPTQKDNKFNRKQQYLDRWESRIPGIQKMDNEQAQAAIYDEMMKTPAGRDSIARMWGTYGINNKGRSNPALMAMTEDGVFDPTALDDDANLAALKNAYVDGMFGARQIENRSTGWTPKLADVPRPGINVNIPTPYKPVDIPVPQTQGTIPDPALNKPAPKEQGRKEGMPWWTQDKINLAAAFINRYNIKKYMPTYVGVDPVLPDPTFFDLTRQLAANQEQAAQSQQMNAMYAGPQRMRAVGSQIQGQGATFAANTLGQVQNQNVDVANNFENLQTQILNNAAGMNAQAKKQYLNELATVNQQYDNAVAQGKEGIRAATVNGLTNAQNTNLVNKMQRQYMIDAPTGQVIFTGGKNLSASEPGVSAGGDSVSVNNYKALYDQFYNQFGDAEKAHAYAMKAAFANKTRVNTDEDGDTSYGFSGPGMNPMMMAQMYGPKPLPFRNPS